MTKITKIFILAITHIIALSIGGSVGFTYFSTQLEKGLVESHLLASQSSYLSWYSSYVEAQRASGNIENYRQSLITFIEALDHAATMESPIDNKKIIISDKMFTYERLSRVEKELGNIEDHKKYEQLAISVCSDLGMNTCQIERISTLAKGLE